MHAQAEYGYAAHWLYKRGITVPDSQVGWIRDLIEILEHADSPEELLEHTRMAMYQDRIFAFTPKGELIQMPKGATPIDFAYAVHTTVGDQSVGAKINGRVVPLRTPIENGDQVQILTSKAQEPQPWWLSVAVTGKARAAIRRYVRHKERDEQVALGRKIYDELMHRLPAKPAKGALDEGLKRLKMASADDLMQAIARKLVSDEQVMDAVMPGSSGNAKAAPMAQREAISIKGLTPGVTYDLSPCCHPVPGDRIVGLRRADEAIKIHTIDCDHLADGVDADWLDIAWGDGSDGGTARVAVMVKNEAGSLASIAGIYAAHNANIVNLKLDARDESFHTFICDLEVHDVQHLMKIVAALRSADAVIEAERE
jgi:(p)ppGpp synthase/HD superfamily hydrolase